MFLARRETKALLHTATHCNILQHTAMHCNILQYTTTHCNTLQHTATHCNTLQHTATHCNTLQHMHQTWPRDSAYPRARLLDVLGEAGDIGAETNALLIENGIDSAPFPQEVTLQLTATHCNSLQLTATHCSALQLTATHCSALQFCFFPRSHTATHCNSLQLTAAHCNSLRFCSFLPRSYTVTHCNSLQRTATHCNALQRTATHCYALPRTATHCNSASFHQEVFLGDVCIYVTWLILQMIGLFTYVCMSHITRMNESRLIEVCCNVLQRVAVCVAMCCSMSHITHMNESGLMETHHFSYKCTATHCNTLQHTANTSHLI